MRCLFDNVILFPSGPYNVLRPGSPSTETGTQHRGPDEPIMAKSTYALLGDILHSLPWVTTCHAEPKPHTRELESRISSRSLDLRLSHIRSIQPPFARWHKHLYCVKDTNKENSPIPTFLSYELDNMNTSRPPGTSRCAFLATNA